MPVLPNPQTWTAFNLMNQDHMQNFLQQLALWGTAVQNPGALLNSQMGSIQGGALQAGQFFLGTVSGAQPVNAANAATVTIKLTMSGNTQLTINNLAIGIPVTITAVCSGTHTLTINANTPAQVAYAVNGKSSGGLTDLTGGVSVSATTLIFSGNSITGPELDLVYN